MSLQHTIPYTARQWFGRALLAPDAPRQIACCTAAIASQPEFAAAWYWRGSVRLGLGQFGPAIQDFSQALRFDPALGYAWDERAYARLQLGERTGGIADFRRALYINPANEAARQYIALLTQF